MNLYYTFRRSILAATIWIPTAVATAATHYTYDKLNRLTEVANNNNGQTFTHVYDAAGNLTRTVRTAVPQSNPELVAWWTFDDCTAKDRSGQSNHGQINAGVTCVAGRNGMAMEFVGGTIDVPSSTSLKLAGSVTIAAVVLLDQANPDGAGILQKGASANFWDYGLVVYRGTPAYRFNRTDWVSTPPTPNPTYNASWHLFTAVVDATDASRPVRVHVDGLPLPDPIRNYLGTDSPVNYINELVAPSDLPLQLGIGHPGFQVRGLIDEARVYRRAFSDSEIRSLAISLGFASP